MRAFLSTLGLLITTAIISTSCEKPAENPPPPVVDRGTFYANISNRQWNTNYSYAELVDEGGIKIVGSINGKTLEMYVPGLDLKAYKVNGVTPASASYTDSSEAEVIHFDTQVNAEKYSGEITLTKLDPINKTVSGTFRLILRNTIDGTLTAAEDGVFNNVKYGIIPGEPLFIGFGKIEEEGALKVFYRAKITGKIMAKTIATFTTTNFNNHVGFYDSISDRFLMMEDNLTNRTLRYINTETGELLYQSTGNNTSGLQYNPPIFHKGKYYSTYKEGSYSQFVDFGPVDGSRGTIYDTIDNSFQFSVSNGTDIYGYTTTTPKMIRYNPVDTSYRWFNMNANYKELDYLGSNAFAVVGATGVGANTKRSIYKLSFSGDSLSEKTLVDLKIDGLADAEQSLAYSTPKNKLLYTVYDATKKRTYLATVDLVTNAIKRDTISGFVDGIKAY